jgi:hypothetical protein
MHFDNNEIAVGLKYHNLSRRDTQVPIILIATRAHSDKGKRVAGTRAIIKPIYAQNFNFGQKLLGRKLKLDIKDTHFPAQ